VLKKIDLKSLLDEIIEKAKNVDLDKFEAEIEEEANKLARQKFLIDTNRFIAAVKRGNTKSRTIFEAPGRFFPPSESADIVHAATCLHTGAILITNDAHFRRISEEGLIGVWSISEAIERVLE
jgi:predicted nucleic acid-binding protein